MKVYPIQEFVLSERSAISAAQEILMPAALCRDEAVCVRGDDAERTWCECRWETGLKVEEEGENKQDITTHLVGSNMIYIYILYIDTNTSHRRNTNGTTSFSSLK